MRLIAAWFLVLFFACPSSAQPDGSPEEPSLMEFQAEAAEYTFRSVTGERPFQQIRQPLLHWANPARIGEDGALFLWTENNRPQVVGTCFKYMHEEGVRRKHEFHSLSEQPIEGRHRGSVIWTPEEKGIEFRPLPGAPPPPAAAGRRTLHLRNQARRFSVQVTERQRTEQTRLIPQPLYQYELEDSGMAAGAVFAFALGTDPEALVLFESRTNSQGELVWHYATARLTFYQLDFFLDGESLLTLEQSENLATHIRSRPDYQRNAYIIFRAD